MVLTCSALQVCVYTNRYYMAVAFWGATIEMVFLYIVEYAYFKMSNVFTM